MVSQLSSPFQHLLKTTNVIGNGLLHKVESILSLWSVGNDITYDSLGSKSIRNIFDSFDDIFVCSEKGRRSIQPWRTRMK